MGTIADLRERVQRRTSNLYDTWFTRRVSIYVTALLSPLGISANTVSALNCLVAIAACALIGLGRGWQVFVGIGLVHLFAVLDSVDGELARLRQRFSMQGLFLEDLAAYTMINGMFLAVAGYVFQTLDLVWPLLIAVATVAFGRNAMQVSRRAILKSVATRRPIATEVLNRTSDVRPRPATSKLRAFVEHHLLHYTNVWITLTTLIVVEQLAELQEYRLVLIAACFYMCAVLLKEAAVIATYLFTESLEKQVLDVYERARALPSGPVSGKALAGD